MTGKKTNNPSGYDSRLRARGYNKRSKGLGKIVKDSPFLIVSFVFHVFILLLLALITAQEPREARQRIRVRVDEMAEEDLTIEPMVIERQLSTDPMAGGGDGGVGDAGGSQGFSDAAGAVDGIDAPSVDVLGMQAAVGGGDSGQFDGRTGSGFDVAAGAGEGVEGAVDQFAVATMNSAARGKTLVVLTIDRTRSVVYLNLPRLIERMDNYFEALDLNLTSEMMNNAEWVVVGYGQDVTFHTSPSRDLEHIKSALRSIDICPTGEQNLGAALNTIIDRYGDYGHRRMLIASMTDGYGSDLRNDALLERTIRRINNSRGSLFVFGHEAAFASNRKRKSLTLDPDLLKPEDRAAIRGFEGQSISDWVDAGPESPRRELWGGSRRWGWDDRHLPASGFGMYAMNRMVLATGGIYFLLEDESDYDTEKLYAQYRPDICSIAEYDRRMNEEPLRAALRVTWDEIPNFYVPRDIRFLRVTESGPQESGNLEERVRSALNTAREGRRYAAERAEQLKELLDRRDVRSMNHYMRWRAHAQVTIAELKRMRFMLGQYAEVLSSNWERHGRRYSYPRFLDVLEINQEEYGRQFRALELIEEGRSGDEMIRSLEGCRYYIRMGSGSAPQDFVGPRAAREEYDEARQYAQMVKEEHVDTPWELLADRVLRNIHPFRVYVRERRPSSPRPPQLNL